MQRLLHAERAGLCGRSMLRHYNAGRGEPRPYCGERETGGHAEKGGHGVPCPYGGVSGCGHGVRSVADGARGDESGLGRFVGISAMDGGVDAGELGGNEGEDGGAASGDAVLGKKDEEIGEEIVEAFEGGELLWISGEFGSEIGNVAVLLRGGKVFAAEAEDLIEDGFAAMAAAGVEVRAAGENGGRGWRFWSGNGVPRIISFLRGSGSGNSVGSGHGGRRPSGVIVDGVRR